MENTASHINSPLQLKHSPTFWSI